MNNSTLTLFLMLNYSSDLVHWPFLTTKIWFKYELNHKNALCPSLITTKKHRNSNGNIGPRLCFLFFITHSNDVPCIFDCCKQSLKRLLPPPFHPSSRSSIHLLDFLIAVCNLKIRLCSLKSNHRSTHPPLH